MVKELGKVKAYERKKTKCGTSLVNAYYKRSRSIIPNLNLHLITSVSRLTGVMVIKRDDYISFLNSTGVKMPTTPNSNNELTLQSTGNNNGNLVPTNNNSQNSINNNNTINNNDTTLNNANTISTTTLTKQQDNYQQKFQQQFQYTPNQQNVTTNQLQSYAKAQLICRPNSHPFPVSPFLCRLFKPKYINIFSFF